jgi:hypothetical protein
MAPDTSLETVMNRSAIAATTSPQPNLNLRVVASLSVRLFILAVTTLYIAGCASGSAPRQLSPTSPPAVTAPTPNYRAMRVRLLTPLGALIVALRGNDRTQAAAHLADFNQVADTILPSVAQDTSKEANALHSAITNVRSHPGDVSALENDRRALLADIP